MSKNTNMYYAQYASSTESEPGYDSDNPEARRQLEDSPSYSDFRDFLEYRKQDELMHEIWKLRIQNDLTLKDAVDKACGMNVQLSDELVRYSYVPEFDSTHIEGFKFKVTLIYVKLLRKWYLSPGRSLVSPVIKLEDQLKNGTYDPIGSNVLKLICKVRELTDIYMERLLHIYECVDSICNNYLDIEVEVNKELTKVKMVLQDKAWPIDIKKTSSKDIINIEITLNETYIADNVNYNYIYDKKAPKTLRAECMDALMNRLSYFLEAPLKEAFENLMGKELIFKEQE